jgi:hypothetical protein
MHLILAPPAGHNVFSEMILVHGNPVLMKPHSESQFSSADPSQQVTGTILCQDLFSYGFPKFLTVKDNEISFYCDARGHDSLVNFNWNHAASGSLA